MPTKRHDGLIQKFHFLITQEFPDPIRQKLKLWKRWREQNPHQQAMTPNMQELKHKAMSRTRRRATSDDPAGQNESRHNSAQPNSFGYNSQGPNLTTPSCPSPGG